MTCSQPAWLYTKTTKTLSERREGREGWRKEKRREESKKGRKEEREGEREGINTVRYHIMMAVT
jgi:hypothetical protein